MSCWPDSRFTDLLGIAHPLIQAPMLGAGADIMIGVAQAGGLASLACATLNVNRSLKKLFFWLFLNLSPNVSEPPAARFTAPGVELMSTGAAMAACENKAEPAKASAASTEYVFFFMRFHQA